MYRYVHKNLCIYAYQQPFYVDLWPNQEETNLGTGLPRMNGATASGGAEGPRQGQVSVAAPTWEFPKDPGPKTRYVGARDLQGLFEGI